MPGILLVCFFFWTRCIIIIIIIIIIVIIIRHLCLAVELSEFICCLKYLYVLYYYKPAFIMFITFITFIYYGYGSAKV